MVLEILVRVQEKQRQNRNAPALEIKNADGQDSLVAAGMHTLIAEN